MPCLVSTSSMTSRNSFAFLFVLCQIGKLNVSVPPGFRTSEIARRSRSGSANCQKAELQTTKSNLAGPSSESRFTSPLINVTFLQPALRMFLLASLIISEEASRQITSPSGHLPESRSVQAPEPLASSSTFEVRPTPSGATILCATRP